MSYGVPSVPPADVAPGAYLLDVREDDEWAAGHIPGSVHVAMSALLDRLGEVPRDRDVVVLCKVGARSAQVTAYLRQQGWDSVANLDGGIAAWAAAGKPLESDTGAPPAVI